MSAVAGVLFFGEAPVASGWVERLTGAMKRRGPDEQTHWFSGSVALGHCMLRTTPESLEEHQPVTSTDAELTLVWDGRIDNREELLRHLQIAGKQVRDASDAELALNCYAAWREAAPEKMLGDYAFAVWDASERRLFCARDPMGARPLYYTHNERFFAFASLEEALTALPEVPLAVNDELVAAYLMPEFGDIDLWQSWIANIRLLPAAQWLTVSAGGAIKAHTYWRLEEGIEDAYESDEACREAFQAVFGEAVRCRMRSLGHVAGMMSGGIDSASIAAMTKRLLPEYPGRQFHTYSAISDQPDSCVETQCIQSLTKDLEGRAHFVSVPSFTGMLDTNDLAHVAWTNAHPLDNSILLPEMMCLAASRDGHRVMLFGGNGDLTMDVPDRYIAHFLRAGQWRHAWRECTGASRNNTYLRGRSPLTLLLENAWTAYVPDGIKHRMRELRRRAARHHAGTSLVRKEFADEMLLSARAHPRPEHPAPSSTSLQREHVRLLRSAHGIPSVLTSCDRIAARYGMESRDPWGDRRVVEFFLRLPLRYKIRDGWTKYLVRSSFAHELDPQVRWRLGKEHLGWNFVSRLLDESRELIARTMDQGLTQVAKYVDPETARSQHLELRQSGSDSARSNVFRLMTLSLWLQKQLSNRLQFT